MKEDTSQENTLSSGRRGGRSMMSGSGGATLPLAVPADPTLIGLRLFFQAAVLDTVHTPQLCLTNDEMRIKVRFVFSVGIGDWRALYKHNVAA